MADICSLCGTKLSFFGAHTLVCANQDERFCSKCHDKLYHMENLERGVTKMSVTGAWSGEDKEMLFCVIGKRQLPQVKDIIMEIDENAFVVVTEANEVLGEGFRKITEN